ncbi:MAG: hypothetical protein IPG05_13255 [Gemmatimonadetes bacterium]|nr:hypothetical protein [Gemmatimonadota bacterium]
MRRSLLLPLILLAACGGDKAASGSGGGVVEAKVRDSSGISIREYPKSSWDAAKQFALSAKPLMAVGGEEGDTTIDLSAGIMGASSASVGRLLPDGRIVVVAGQPPQMMVIDTNGKKSGIIGRAGEGPGEYRLVTQMLQLGSDTLLAFDMMRRKGILFGLDGSSRGERDFPTVGSLPIAPTILGVLNDGTTIHRGDGLSPKPEAGGDPNSYQLPLPIVALIPGGARYDTLFMVKGIEMYSSTISAGGQTAAIPRQIGFGKVPQLAVGPEAIWFTPSDKFEIHRRSTGGALLDVIRLDLPTREVTDADKAEFKRVLTEALGRVRSMAPAEIIDGEIKKLDETKFAKHFPAVGQMQVDPTGALWANIGSSPLDSTTTWAIFDPTGALQGRVTLPKGGLFAVGTDRLVIRREDPATGLVRLEVWGFTR